MTEDLTGMAFGDLTVIEPDHHGKWLCRCSCGNIRHIQSHALKNGRYSCGCKADYYKSIHNSRQYNPDYKRLYNIWKNMNGRCYDPSNVSYERYGSKGITVCNEWREYYYVFQDWAKQHGYKPDLSIDRIDNSLGYNPSNCKWSTILEQANNKSNNRYLNIDGEEHTIAQWSRISGTKQGLIRQRYCELGWNVKDSIYGRSGVDPNREVKHLNNRWLTKDEKIYISENYETKGMGDLMKMFNISRMTVKRYKDYKRIE